MIENFCRTLRQCGLVRGLITEYETRCFSGESRAALSPSCEESGERKAAGGGTGTCGGIMDCCNDQGQGKGERMLTIPHETQFSL